MSTTLIRFRRLLLVGAVVAGAIVPTASAVGRPPDVQDAASATLAAQVSPPDVRDAALRNGLRLSSVEAGVSRPPDISDAALSVQYGSLPTSDTGFSWTDWAIGIGSGIGLALLLGGCALTSRQLRRRIQTA
ncbi:MAG TPA: hypothetical protein VFA24_08635 [Gaiellaceae bacterium]|nr:hypothetical protein [Gaiellaceae bacterium]